MKFTEFVKSSALHLYTTDGLSPFHYSDGTIVEQHLAKILSGANDLSTGSTELMKAEIDWPSTYHLSAERSNLLRWVDFGSHQRVLEIGCGCGAISRFLGEKGVDLYAIEGSKERSYLAALRCRDLPSVKVYNANIQDITPEAAFDLVIMIGVLEYAGVYIKGESPWSNMLEIVRSFLKPDGMLIVAIENKVGLKYWTGCSEDHGAGLFASIHGYIARDKIQTFSKPELTTLLETAGFSVQKFFYPWPDYKLPTVIIHEPRAGLYLDNWIASEFRDYRNQRQNIINDRLALNTIYKAGLLPDMSNSFLVFASQHFLKQSAYPEWVVRAYSVKRAKPFWTETTFYGPDKPVMKEQLYKDTACQSSVLFRPEPSPWYPGRQLEQEFLESMVAKDLDRWNECLQLYRSFLIDRFGTHEKDEHGAYLLKGGAFDCLPKNVIITDTGLKSFDLEWIYEGLIPEYFIIVRMLIDLHARYKNYLVRIYKNDIWQFMLHSLIMIYPWLTREHMYILKSIEQSFQNYVIYNISSEIKYRKIFLCSGHENYEKRKSAKEREKELSSVIIPVFNKSELTKQCLTHLSQVTYGNPYEVILIDNGSTDDTSSFLATLRGDVQVIRNHENLGFAKACNQGARAARGRYLVFLNNDTIPQLGWLKALVDEVEGYPEIAVVGSKLLYPNDTIQHAGVVFSRAFATPYHLYNGFPADAPVVNRRREFQVVTAACMLVRREMFEAVGGFDEGYRNGFEDVDLCLKIREQGGRVVYQPKSVLYHLESQTPGRKDHDAENGRRLLERWESRWLTDEDTIYVPDGYAIRTSHESGRLSYRLTTLTDREENARWERVAEIERQGQAGNMEAVCSFLAQPDSWPYDPGVLRWAAQLCDRAGVPSYAEAFWRRALDFGATPEVLVALTRISLEKGALDEAESHLQELITQIPTHGEGWLLQGILALQRQDFLKAKAAFENTLRYGSNTRKARKGLGMAAMGLGQMQTAWEMFAEVLADEIDDAEAIHCLLRVGTALERWQPLTDYLSSYLKLNPGELSVRFALTGVQVRLGDWEAARGNYEMIRLLEPTFAGLDDLAQILEKGSVRVDL